MNLSAEQYRWFLITSTYPEARLTLISVEICNSHNKDNALKFIELAPTQSSSHLTLGKSQLARVPVSQPSAEHDKMTISWLIARKETKKLSYKD